MEGLFKGGFFRGNQMRNLNVAVHCFGANAWFRSIKANRTQLNKPFERAMCIPPI